MEIYEHTISKFTSLDLCNLESNLEILNPIKMNASSAQISYYWYPYKIS